VTIVVLSSAGPRSVANAAAIFPGYTAKRLGVFK
jgi:hypothetical protein